MKVKLGVENLIDHPPEDLGKKRLGLLCHPASVCCGYRHSRFAVAAAFPKQLTALFAPQHGFWGARQDNMIESDDMTDARLNIPVYSLYGKVRKPTPRMLENIDVLLVDLQDVGTRVYTFIWTMALCMQACAEQKKKVVVLDRPNPIGGRIIEGNILDADYKSFVGLYPLPMRPGMTIGELAAYLNATHSIGCDLTIIPMTGWKREMFWDETHLPWVAPSPNMPTLQTALVYPGQALFEGTNVSEGRGTTMPFEQFGAPFIDADIFHDLSAPGAVFRPVSFEPTSGKWTGKTCNGLFIHPTEPARFESYALTLELLQRLLIHYPRDFQWKQQPYEYEFDKLPIDIILGSGTLRKDLESGIPVAELQKTWQADIVRFRKERKPYLLY
ncbi:MAG: DUF1343 domain-containing protein [Alphaproteobacteria bacterium]|nr:DUF1343 domain-containing protein [Alphaproteobacteria bacterium]